MPRSGFRPLKDCCYFARVPKPLSPDMAGMTRIATHQEYVQAYELSVRDPEGFWAEQAKSFIWRRPWERVLDWNFRDPDIRWFQGGTLNITENCLDRHLAIRGDKPALIWEPNDPDQANRTLTYRQLHQEVCRFAEALRAQGADKGDRICFYMPMVPELMIGLLACARIGAVHSVVFAGFSAQSLAERIDDATCKLVICSDGNFRGAKSIPIKAVVDEALSRGCPSVEKVIVLKRTGEPVSWTDSRDVWWHDAIRDMPIESSPEVMDAEDLLFVLYTSGSTGKPKGVVHTIGGYMVYTAYSFAQVFQPEENDIYWCTADIGWITGHSYIVYGPLLHGTTVLMFEGVPNYPNPGRFWEVCQKHSVSLFYTAPTALRSLMAAGDEWVAPYDLSSIRVLGSVGEPINEEAWHWYQNHVGKGRCPIVDTWWQTETGGILISPLAGVTDPLKPCFAMQPLPGVQPVLVSPEGVELTETEAEGLLCIRFPWPSMLRTTYGDHERCRQSYFAAFPNLYFTGDGCRRDADGHYRIIGRVDDVINVSGHRLGTAEIENAIDEHEDVVEAAVVGYPHAIKGQGIYAYLVCGHQVTDHERFKREVLETVTRVIGPIAKPDHMQIVSGLPKTRSGKIMRRILRKIACGETDSLGDTSTLLNPEIVDEILSDSLHGKVS